MYIVSLLSFWIERLVYHQNVNEHYTTYIENAVTDHEIFIFFEFISN